MFFPPSIFALILRRRASAVAKDGRSPGHSGPHPSRRAFGAPQDEGRAFAGDCVASAKFKQAMRQEGWLKGRLVDYEMSSPAKAGDPVPSEQIVSTEITGFPAAAGNDSRVCRK